MTLSMLILDEGRGKDEAVRRWTADEVGLNTAIDIHYDDGGKAFFVVEPDSALRKVDPESWEPDHPLARSLSGMKTGSRFVGPDGREGAVQQIRHKYIARLHHVLEQHEARFPQVFGFRSVSVEFDTAGGLDELIAQVKSRHDWAQDEVSQYAASLMPIGVLARRVGTNPIDAASGLSALGVKLKVAIGNHPEREAATRAVIANGLRGCVLDLLSYWTAWRLGALDAVQATCGKIHVPPSVLDSLRERRDELARHAQDGRRTISYENGKLALQEVSAEVLAEEQNETVRAIVWAEANVAITPIVAGDDLPEELKKFIRLARSDVFDALVLARQSGLLLISDDLPTRQIDSLLGGNGGAWLHVALGAARDQKHIDLDAYVRWSSNLIAAGHNYLGITGLVLSHAARLDAMQGDAVGPLFRTLSEVIGGQSAEPISHVRATLECVFDLWSDPKTRGFRQPVTGHLLRQLVRERTADYPAMLRGIVRSARRVAGLTDYVRGWLRGHFISHIVLGDDAQQQRSR
jgi:hypothetical protein